MIRRGSTLLELLTVFAIMAVLLAILIPVAAKVKESAKVGASKSNLRQIHLQTRLYQVDWDGAEFGNAFAMGLPPSPAYERIPAISKLRPPNAPSVNSPMVGSLYWVNYNDPNKDGLDPSWQSYALTNQGQSVMYVDPFNNPADLPLDKGAFVRRRILGITLDGNIRTKIDYGDWMDRSWWNKK